MGEHAEEGWQREAFGKGHKTMTEVENVPLPAKAKKTSTRGRKQATANKPKLNGAADLVNALKFISMAQKPIGTTYQVHCMMRDHWAVAFDGVLTVGTKINEEIEACPNTTQLMSALNQCGELLSITQLSEFVVSVKSERFKAAVECVSFVQMPELGIDECRMKIGNELKEAFRSVEWLVSENAQRAFYNGALLKSGTIVSTNGHLIVEYWHGFEFPFEIIVPKSALQAIYSTDKELVGIGGSEDSLTFYFADESFIKTQIYKERFPHYEKIFDDAGSRAAPVPPELWQGIDAVSPFCKSKAIFFDGPIVGSADSDDRGARYEMSAAFALQPCRFNFEYLKKIKPWFSNVRLLPEKLVFSQGNLRGACAAIIGNGDNESTD